MPIDWDQFDQDIDSAIAEGIEKTDDALASKASSLTRMTDAQVQELFPEPADAKALAELMKIVKSSDDRNTKINNIIDNSEKFARIVLTIADKLI